MEQQPHLLYLHGFNSSPASHKAQQMKTAMTRYGIAAQLTTPAIVPQPDLAATQLSTLARSLAAKYQLSIAGSSLGGFYATWLAEQLGCKAVLINPAVRPHILLKKYLGENLNYHTDESWLFEQGHIDALAEMYVEKISFPDHYMVLLQSGDETLDYRQAESYYAGCRMLIEQGGDHSFVDFDRHIDSILEFCDFTRQDR